MGKRHKEHHDEPTAQPPVEPADEAGDPPAAAAADDAGVVGVTETATAEEPAGEAAAVQEPDEAARLRDQLGELNDRYLRLAAEFDNFRKRVVRDRATDQERAQADLLRNILEGLDDLGRIAHLDLTAATVDDVATGVQMVERKLLDELAATGLERVTGEGERFDPNRQEAVGSLPAQDPDQDGLVAQVLQAGYRFGGTLLRPARVLVFVDRGGGGEEG